MQKFRLIGSNTIITAIQAEHPGTLLDSLHSFETDDWILNENGRNVIITNRDINANYEKISETKEEKQGKQLDWSEVFRNPDRFYETLGNERKTRRKRL